MFFSMFGHSVLCKIISECIVKAIDALIYMPSASFWTPHSWIPSTLTRHTSLLAWDTRGARSACIQGILECPRFNAPRRNLQPVRNWSQCIVSPDSLSVGHIPKKTGMPVTCSHTHTHTNWLALLPYLTPTPLQHFLGSPPK